MRAHINREKEHSKEPFVKERSFHGICSGIAVESTANAYNGKTVDNVVSRKCEDVHQNI